MSAYLHDSIVSAQESQALKEMIFSRARERAAALAGDVQDSYTSSMQADVMDIARNSFQANKNPFSIDNFEKEPVVKEGQHDSELPTSKNSYQDELGFSQKNVEIIKSQIHFTNKNTVEKVASESINANMVEAREDFNKNSSKSSFMGALDFLNSQATITLVRSKGKSFDAIA
jgi:hypothetical protein